MKKDMPLVVSIWDNDGNFADVKSEAVTEIAQNKAMDRERLENQLVKMGNTPFLVKSPEIELDEGITMPVSEINATRRAAAEKLSQKICEIIQMPE